MKNSIITTLLLYHYVSGSNSSIKVFTSQNNKDEPNTESVKLSDLLPSKDGVGDFSICYRFFLQRLMTSGKITLMKFDHNGEDHIRTYLIWTVDGSTAQLFQRVFHDYIQQEKSGFLDQVKYIK